MTPLSLLALALNAVVTVQITVLVAAVVLVVVIGTAAYLIRKKLGLTAPPPQAGAGGHH